MSTFDDLKKATETEVKANRPLVIGVAVVALVIGFILGHLL